MNIRKVTVRMSADFVSIAHTYNYEGESIVESTFIYLLDYYHGCFIQAQSHWINL